MSIYINKDELLKKFDIEQRAMELHGQEFCSSFLNAGREISTEWWYAENIVDYMPTIEIIHCKECKYMTEYYDADENVTYWICSEWDSGTDYNGYCHYGERKDDE